MGFFDRVKKFFGVAPKPPERELKRAPKPSEAKPATRTYVTPRPATPRTQRTKNIDALMKTLKREYYGRNVNRKAVERQLKNFSPEVIEQLANTTRSRDINSIIADEWDRLVDEGIEQAGDEPVNGVHYH